MKRMRDRLNLTSNVYTQNHTVRKAMEQLRDIGYLDYTEFKRGRATYFSVHYRNPKLISSPVKVPRKEEEEKAPETNMRSIKALRAAGIILLNWLKPLSDEARKLTAICITHTAVNIYSLSCLPGSNNIDCHM